MRPGLLLAVMVGGCSAEQLEALEAEREDPAVVERSHAVVLHFERGAAVLQVTRAFENTRTEPERDTRRLRIPKQAIATSFALRVDGRVVPAELLAAEEATARWSALTDEGEAMPAPLGLLERSTAEALELQLFAVPPRARLSVEYTLWLQPQYAAGALEFTYPFEGPVPTFGGEGVLGARTLEQEGEVRVTVPHAPGAPLKVRWAVAKLSGERALWRLEFDTAAALGAAPERPSVVFVIDASHSQGEAGIAAQLELLPPYLAHVPDAEVEVVLYRRVAQRLFGQFIPAGTVAQRLASLDPKSLQPGNGSHLELGVAEAARALGQATSAGRVVLFTDERLRDGFSLEGAIAALARAPQGTVTHVVVRDGLYTGDLSEARDERSTLAPLAAAGGGVVLDILGSAARDPVGAKAILEGLVRPLRIDGLSVEAVGLTSDTLEVPAVLGEGEALRQMAFAPQPPPRITVRGKLWARPIDAVIESDLVLSHQLPGLALGDEGVESQLGEEERLYAARAAHAVSSATSFLAAPFDAAPSTAGGGLRLNAFSCSACGGFGFSCGTRGSSGRAFEMPMLPTLQELVRPIAERCGAEDGAALEVETTNDEIVDVKVTGVADPACLTEGVWGLRLPEHFRGHHHFAL